MKNYGFRGFIIAFLFMFILTFRSCSNSWQGSNGYITLTIISSIFGLIIGLVGLLIGKQFKTNDELSEIEFLKKYKKIILISIISIFGLTFIYKQLNSISIFNNSTSSTLENNLDNLNGKWEYYNRNQHEYWFIEIRYDEGNKRGTYILSQQNENWGENKNTEKRTIDTGEFNLVEGYDRYGHKAFIGENPNKNSSVFLITEIDNKYAVDWMLRLRIIEEDMFGEKMNKTSNN